MTRAGNGSLAKKRRGTMKFKKVLKKLKARGFVVKRAGGWRADRDGNHWFERYAGAYILKSSSGFSVVEHEERKEFKRRCKIMARIILDTSPYIDQ
jgi:hypothetical protein